MQKDDLNLLIDVFIKSSTREKLNNLILGIMTLKEIEEFAERIRIIQLLKKGIGQHDVARKLHVGVATVSRGAKEIKEGRFTYV
jgi:TrpR family transcriptional regulator, trp operon repressor